jgi:hypothetical protein
MAGISLLFFAATQAVSSVSQPTLSVNPTEGDPGDSVTVSGSGWSGGETVYLWFIVNLGEDGTQRYDTAWYHLGMPTVADDGTFTADATVPELAESGAQHISANNIDGSRVERVDYDVFGTDATPTPTTTLTPTGTPYPTPTDYPTPTPTGTPGCG